MNRFIAIILIIITVFCCFTACQKNADTETDTETDDIKVIDFNTTREPEESTTIKNNKTMKINVPASFIEGKANGDLRSYAATYGYEITEEKDGSLTMKMDGITYSLMLSNIGMEVMMSLGEIVDSGDYPYVVKLQDYNEDFSYILMQIDTDKYKKHKDKIPCEDLAFLIGRFGLYYQCFTIEKDNKCEVVLASSKTGEIIHREIYTDK